MRAFLKQRTPGVLSLLAALLAATAGCPSSGGRARGPGGDADLGQTVGSLAEVPTPEPIPVEGFGLVGSLPGTGSATCPPQVRAYLKRYILTRLPDRSLDVDALIDSTATAVVRLEGTIPALASKGDHFDLRVSLLAGSETASLQGGWLYDAELRPRGAGGAASRPLATAAGPAFVNLVGVAEPDLTSAYVLGGGRVSDDYSALILLPKPDYALAGAIRNRLSERYGANVATAVSPRAIEYTVPSAYRRRKMRFVRLVAATYMSETAELTQRRVNRLVARLAAGEDAERREIALEAVGRESLEPLAQLLDAPDEQVRLRAARVMLNLRDDRGLPTLRQIALTDGSAHRLEAIGTVAAAARRNEAAALMRILLRDRDPRIVLAAYERLRDMGDVTITQDFIGRSFYLERIVQTDHKAIYVARRGDPRIVIFGAPLACRDSVFIESPDGTVVVNAEPGEGYVSLMRKDPVRPGAIGPLQTGYVVSEVIRALGAEYSGTEEGHLSGLGVSYAEVIALLERLCASGAVGAAFWPGPLPEFE